jgi:hypothetical protein
VRIVALREKRGVADVHQHPTRVLIAYRDLERRQMLRSNPKRTRSTLADVRINKAAAGRRVGNTDGRRGYRIRAQAAVLARAPSKRDDT